MLFSIKEGETSSVDIIEGPNKEFKEKLRWLCYHLSIHNEIKMQFGELNTNTQNNTINRVLEYVCQRYAIELRGTDYDESFDSILNQLKQSGRPKERSAIKNLELQIFQKKLYWFCYALNLEPSIRNKIGVFNLNSPVTKRTFIDKVFEFLSNKYRIQLTGSYDNKINDILILLIQDNKKNEIQDIENDFLKRYPELKEFVESVQKSPQNYSLNKQSHLEKELTFQNQTKSQPKSNDSLPKLKQESKNENSNITIIPQQLDSNTLSILKSENTTTKYISSKPTQGQVSKLNTGDLLDTKESEHKKNDSKSNSIILDTNELVSTQVRIGILSCQLIKQRIDYFEWIQEFAKAGFKEIEWLNRAIISRKKDSYYKIHDSGAACEIAAIVAEGKKYVIPTCYLTNKNIGGIIITSWFKVESSLTDLSEIIPAIAYISGSSYKVETPGIIR